MSLISKEHLNLVLQSIKNLLSKKADKSEIVQSDWNQTDETATDYVKNRTHWDSRKTEKISISFDGVLDGKEYLDINGDGSLYVVKVSDLTPSIEEVVGGTFSIVENGEVVDTIEVTTDLVQQNSDTLYGIDGDSIMVALEDADIGNGFVLAKGTWFLMWIEEDLVGYYSDLSYSKESGELHKLDAKYLPDDIGVQPDWNETDESSKAYIWNKPEVALQSDISEIRETISAPKDYIILSDTTDGYKYKVYMQNGNLVTSIAGTLDDFTYTTNDDGTYTITGWNQTYFGEPSTVMIVPDDSNIIL